MDADKPSSSGENPTDVDANLEHEGLKAFEMLSTFLEEDEWFPQRLPQDEQHIYRMLYRGTSGEMICYAQIRTDLKQFLFYIMAPVKAEPDQRLAVAEYMTRANYGLHIGNLEMDFDDGEIRYKSSLDFDGTPVTANLFRNAIYPAVLTMDRYLPGLMSVIFGGKSPAEAVAAIEG